MRVPEYLSFSALALFERSPTEYYIRYIHTPKLDREPQTDAMSVGSAFDALVKNRLSMDLFGPEHTERLGLRLRDLVPKQCDSHTLPESLEIAIPIWEQYEESGAYRALLDEVQLSAVEPQFEVRVQARIGGVEIMGYPDLYYHNREGALVVADFKVSGSCSRAGVSPQQGYMICRDIHGSRTNGCTHKKFVPGFHLGEQVSEYLIESHTDYWASQLSGYAWCLGEKVGSQNFLVRIEQLAVRPGCKVKCCTYKSRVSEEYQAELLERYQRCWSAVKSNWIFNDMNLLDSQRKASNISISLQGGLPDLDPVPCFQSGEMIWPD